MSWLLQTNIFIISSLLTLFSSVSLVVSANVRVMPRTIADFSLFDIKLLEVETVWVEGVKVAYANYAALRRDFPKLQQYSNEQIDALLIHNFSYISKHQLDLGEIRNTTIPAVVTKTRKSYRPYSYGRADVMEFFDFNGDLLGLIDRKGTGNTKSKVASELKSANELGPEKIQTKDHSDGLMSHGETLVETSREKARRQIYQIENVDAETVESYFSMLLPFQIKKGNGQLDPAGFYGRQAHLGHLQSGFETPLPKSERSAIQMDYFGAGFDQGLVKIKDPRLAKTFGNFGEKVTDVQKLADWAWAHDTAQSFYYNPNRAFVDEHLDYMTHPLNDVLPKDKSERSSTLLGDLERFFARYGELKDPQSRWIMSYALVNFVNSELIEKFAVKSKIAVLISDADKNIRKRMVPGLRFFQPEQRASMLLQLSRDPSMEVQDSFLNYVTNWRYFSVAEKDLVMKNLSESSFLEIRTLVAKKLLEERTHAQRVLEIRQKYEQTRAQQQRVFCFGLFK